ncbi:MAG: type II secretion system F family protein [Fusobacterium sp.]|nr:type II secretion system F family protein [Fusobacterium sp.]
MLYPLTILIFTLCIISFLILNILPNFIDIFEENNIELPLATKILLTISNNFTGILITLILLIISFILFLKYVNKNKDLKFKKDKFLFNFILLKNFYRYSFSSNFYRNFAVLLDTGINIDEILEVVYSTTENLFIKNKLFKVKNSVVSGFDIATSLKHIDFFNERFLSLLISAEESGRLTETLLFISEILKQDLEYKTKKFLTILEPLLMLFLGIIVGFIIIAIYLPIISVNNIF